MSQFTEDEVADLAALIRLELTPSERRKFAKEMEETTGFINNLQELPTKDVAPTYQTTGISNRYLNEEINERQLDNKEALSNAPAAEKGHFKIKGLGYSK